MRYTKALDNIFKESLELKILRYLIQTKRSYSGREIARKTDISAPQAHKILKYLSKEGLINYQSIGTSIAYSINESNYLVTDLVEPLLNKERRLIKDIARLFVKEVGQPVVTIILFGSIASGTEKPTSDIDWLIILENERRLLEIKRKLLSAERKITTITGNDVSIVLKTTKQFRSSYNQEDWPPIRDIKKHGRVVYGKTISEVLKIGSKKH